MIKQRAAGKKALLVSGYFEAAAIDYELCAFFDADIDLAFDAFQCLTGHDRTHLRIELKTIFNL